VGPILGFSKCSTGSADRRGLAVIKERRADDPEAQAGYEQARRAYEIGREVRRQREAAGLTQRQLADLAGMTQSVIARLEAGGTEPTLATLDRVARALGLELTVRFQRVA
jgi:ribosome-binding protein aMBF1 (putative translation factor)